MLRSLGSQNDSCLSVFAVANPLSWRGLPPLAAPRALQRRSGAARAPTLSSAFLRKPLARLRTNRQRSGAPKRRPERSTLRRADTGRERAARSAARAASTALAPTSRAPATSCALAHAAGRPNLQGARELRALWNLARLSCAWGEPCNFQVGDWNDSQCPRLKWRSSNAQVVGRKRAAVAARTWPHYILIVCSVKAPADTKISAYSERSHPGASAAKGS